MRDFTYGLDMSDDGTFTITLFDIDGTTSSETASFLDNNTLIFGETAISRIN